MNKIRTENYDHPSKGLLKISEDGSNDVVNSKNAF